MKKLLDDEALVAEEGTYRYEVHRYVDADNETGERFLSIVEIDWTSDERKEIGLFTNAMARRLIEVLIKELYDV